MIDRPELAEPGSLEHELLSQIDASQLPGHVAIIMDGNGRWARDRRLPRVAGHRAGIESVRDTVETSARLGIDVLTLYAFSQENWKRPRAEVSTLMALLKEYVRKELETLIRHDIRLNVIGRIEDLPASPRRELERALERTRENRGLLFNLALSYGGRTEILDACRELIRGGVDPDALDAEAFASRLYTAGQPDPDLLIRTSGELRVSNFLLWQIAYAEIWVTDTRWPDFRRRHFFQAILDYQRRERRYGGLKSQPAEDAAPALRG
ncbi:MAG: isoprenyl transferase [Candidatus Eiseniibacteriota bacterium]|jgi:undecaprenyl diphosphate synthase